VNLGPLFSKCWKLGKRTCIPLFNAKLKIYEMAEVSSETQYRIGHYGIKEPLSPTPFPMNQIDLIAVPGVAFDRAGNRLGRGGGYYDRLLDGFPGVSVAVAFSFQILHQIPHEAHDRPVDSLITEREIIKRLNEH
jgi:5-formyltetrahydrofolate cyclo-ligase